MSTRRKTRVGLVSQWFPPEPADNVVSIARALQRREFDVQVLTGVPNYPTGTVHSGYSPWRISTEIRDGLPVLRSPLYPSHSRSTIGRIANLSSYATTSSIVGGRVLRDADVALVLATPATAATPAMLSRLRWGTPYVLLVLDLWPDSIFATGFLESGVKRRLTEAAMHRFLRHAYHGASHVAVTSPGMRDLLLDRGVPAEKVSVIYNWVDESVMRPAQPDRDLRPSRGLEDDFVVMYAGNHGAAQALDVAINAMAKLRSHPRIKLVLVGDGIDKPALRSLAEHRCPDAVNFVDPVPASRIPALMAAADIQLVSLARRDLFRVTMPSKIQSIMACGQPILLVGEGDSVAAVKSAGAGLTVEPDDPDSLALAILQASTTAPAELSAMGGAGLDYYRAILSESVNGDALAVALRAAARTDRNGGGRQ